MGGAEQYSRQREQHAQKPRGRRVSTFREGGQVVHREVMGRKAKNVPLSAPGFRTRAYHRILCPYQGAYLSNGENKADTFQGERALSLCSRPPFTLSSEFLPA